MVTRHDTKEIILGDCIDTLKGFAFKSQWYSDEGVPLIKVSDFSDDSISIENLTFIPKEIAKDFDKYRIRKDDIIIQTVGSWPRNPKSVVGKSIRVPAICDNALLNQNAVKIIPKANIDGNFLFYLLRSKQFKDYIINTAQGAANQASITLESIRNFKFQLPELEIQRKIGAQIRRYDSLIENNATRINVLETIAKMIYDEWFVKFKFPGHEKVKMVDSELGEIPEGWKIKKLSEYLDFKRGVEPGSKNYFDKEFENSLRFIRVGDLGNRGSNIFVKKEVVQDAQVSRRDILISMDGTVGIVKIGEEGCISSGIRKIIFKKKLPWSFVFFLLKSKSIQDTIKAHAKGTTILHAASSIDYMQFLLPSDELLSEFENTVDKLIKMELLLKLKIENLTTTRDLLLPKLISGELDVSELDIRVSEVEV